MVKGIIQNNFNKKLSLKTVMMVIILYIITYQVLLTSHLNPDKVNSMSILLAVLAPITAVYIMWNNVIRLKGRKKVFWILLSSNCIIYLIATIIWRLDLTSNQPYMFPGTADILWILNLLLFSVALLYRFYSEQEKYHIFKVWFDALILITVFCTYFWIYLINPILFDEKPEGISLFFTIAYISAYLLVILASILIFVSIHQKFTVLQSITYLLGIIIYAICDVYYLYEVTFNEFILNRKMESIWSVGLLIIAASSCLEEEKERERNQVENKQRSFNIKRIIIPYIAVILLIISTFFIDHKVIPFISLSLIFVFVFIRQILTLMENNRVLVNIEKLNHSLEQKVRQRTLELEKKNTQLFYLNENLEIMVRQRTIELEKTKERLSESNQLYQSLFKNHPNFIVTYNQFGIVTKSNKIIDRNINDYAKETMDDGLGQKFFTNALKGQAQSFEKSFIDENKEEVYFRITFVPMLINGNTKGVFGIFQDMTEQKIAEELLRKSEMLNAVSYLAAGMAHEIRNPLTSIKGFLQFMNENPVNQQYREIIFTELNQIEYIVNEFLSLSGPKEKVFEYIDIEQLIQKISTIMITNTNGIMIDVKSEKGLPQILCVEKELSQVFVNIIKNAIEASFENTKIEIYISLINSGALQIVVKDFGVGIPLERMKRLGEPYYSNKEKGIGLGLMICYKIIKEHKGFIRFKSEVGRGTSVFVSLPVGK